MRKLLCTSAAIVGAGLINSASAAVTLPDVGVDGSEYVTAAGVAVGAVVATVFGVYVAIKVVRIAMAWVSKVKG